MSEQVKFNANELDVQTLQSEMNILTRPDGSAVFCQGDTVMMAGVYGPMEAKQQHMLIDKACVQAHYRPKSGLPGVTDRFYESFLRNTCETAIVATLYPRTVISVIVQELQHCGGLISCAINAACMAMLDAGIEMKFLVGGVCCMLDADGKLTVEPGYLKLENATATFSVVFESTKGDIVASHTTGMFTQEQYMEAIRLCREASLKVFAHYRNSVKPKKEIK